MRAATGLLLMPLLALAPTTLAHDLPEALVDFVDLCVLPRLESRPIDSALLERRFVARPPETPREQDIAAREHATFYRARQQDAEYVLRISRNGTCRIRYPVPVSTPYGTEFLPARRRLKMQYYGGQIGPAAEPGKGLTAIMMKNRNTGFDVVYTFKEDSGIRHVDVYTNGAP